MLGTEEGLQVLGRGGLTVTGGETLKRWGPESSALSEVCPIGWSSMGMT